MIQIKKPKTVPKILAAKGKKQCNAHCASYSKNPKGYEKREEEFKFLSSIYAHTEVKQALIKAQHKKCCFCESIVGDRGDVEHFRPKGAYQQAKGDSLNYPGYYWLAYEWENLYLSCSACNQREKKNLFPLQDSTQRATNHNQPISQEQPMFIDCGQENPEDFIGFRGEIAYAINGNQRGQMTIDYLGINQEDLIEKRLQRLQMLKGLNEVVFFANKDPTNQELQDLANGAKSLLANALLDHAEFAAASRCAIHANFDNDNFD
jgi:uncharacterized protein (TIGR02646 family)